MFFLFVCLKVPLLALCWLVWWAIHQVDDPAQEGGDDATLRRAMAYGTACASFNVEGFGSERLYTLERAEIDARVAELERISRF